MHLARRKQVLVFAGGGLSHVSGGVGTSLRYLVAEWSHDPGCLAVRVIDTRGPGGMGSAALHFALALMTLVWGTVRGRVACVHINMTTRGSAWRKAVLCALARLAGMPVVLHLHGADFFEFVAGLPGLACRLLRACIAGVDCVVVIGAEWRRRLSEELGIRAEQVRIVRNGVPAAPQAAAPDGPVHILFLGRIGARKGVPELVAALGSPMLAARDWTATIAGDGDARWLAQLIAASGVQGRIRAPGWLAGDQAAALLARVHILVLPSHHEVMPIAILEAMARGLAIVATPVGALPEILADGANALLIAPGDPDALTDALVRLIDDPALRHRLGAQARRDFAEHLDIRVPAAELQAIYREAMSGRCGVAAQHPASA